LTCPALNNLGEVLAKIYGIDMEQWKKDKKFMVKKLGKEIPYSVYTDALKYDVFAAAEKISCPTRLIIGTKDQYIPLDFAEEFVRRAANCEFNFIPGANHTFSNGTGRFLFEAMMEFFREQKYRVEKEKSHLLEPE
jgi:pimeloyl-ACP methyl ester carboxylesterase